MDAGIGDIVCRMCFASAEEADEDLISPCCCRGSLEYVHLSCLVMHYTTRGIWWDLCCPTCEFPYECKVADELGRQGLVEAERSYGRDSIEVASVLTNLGSVHGAAGNVTQQRDLLQRALTIYERQLGHDHPDVAVALTSLGFAHGVLGDVNLQQQLLERALQINEQVYGLDAPEVADTLAVLANAAARQHDTEKQHTLIQRSLRIYEGVYGPDHPRVAVALAGLGNACGDLGDNAAKRYMLQRALNIVVRVYGPTHPEVATVMANLAYAHWSLGHQDQAIPLLWQAKCIFLRDFGESDRDSQLAIQALEDLSMPDKAVLGANLLESSWTLLHGFQQAAAVNEDTGVTPEGLLGARVFRVTLSNLFEFADRLEGKAAAPGEQKAVMGARLLRSAFT